MILCFLSVCAQCTLDFTVTPQILYYGHRGENPLQRRVKFRCNRKCSSGAGPGMKIGRLVSATSNDPIQFETYTSFHKDHAGGVAVNDQKLAAIQVHGSYSQNYLEMNITNISCSETNIFQCRLDFYKAQIRTKVWLAINTTIDARVFPGEASMTVRPKQKAYVTNNQLFLCCYGVIGRYPRYPKPPEIRWVWVTKRKEEEDRFVRPPSPTDIVHPGLTIGNNSCYEKRQSGLTITLSEKTSKNLYRCFMEVSDNYLPPINHSWLGVEFYIHSVGDPEEKVKPSCTRRIVICIFAPMGMAVVFSLCVVIMASCRQRSLDTKHKSSMAADWMYMYEEPSGGAVEAVQSTSSGGPTTPDQSTVNVISGENTSADQTAISHAGLVREEGSGSMAPSEDPSFTSYTPTAKEDVSSKIPSLV